MPFLFVIDKRIHRATVAFLKIFLAAVVNDLGLLLRRHVGSVHKGKVACWTVGALHLTKIGHAIIVLT